MANRILQNTNFLRLWSGQTVSLLGSNITTLAIPLLAVNELGASASQMGILQMAQYLPFLFFGLFAGIWVDRRSRRPVMLLADIARAITLLSIPLAALISRLSIELLFIVVFIMGSFNLLFEAAYSAFLPVIVRPEHLADGNGKLQISAATTEIIGPGFAGWLIQFFSASIALLGDALSFVISAVALATVHADETSIITPKSREGTLIHDLREGVSAVMQNIYIRPLTLCSAFSNIFINMHLAIYILYLTRSLGLNPAQIGLLYSLGSIGGLIGALSVGRVTRRIGVGSAIVAETLAVGVAALAIPLLSTRGASALLLLALAQGFWGLWLPFYIVNAASLRQVITPNHLLGRVAASSRFISWGAAAVGFLIGGFVAERIGFLPTLYIAGGGLLASSLWVILSPIRTLKVIPTPIVNSESERGQTQEIAILENT